MSETSEYIMGQVRSMLIIQKKLMEAVRDNKRLSILAYTEQQSQELQFLHQMLQRHPPHRPTLTLKKGAQGNG